MAKMIVGRATAFEERPPRAEYRPPGRAVRRIPIPDKANVEASKAKAERSAANREKR